MCDAWRGAHLCCPITWTTSRGQLGSMRPQDGHGWTLLSALSGAVPPQAPIKTAPQDGGRKQQCQTDFQKMQNFPSKISKTEGKFWGKWRGILKKAANFTAQKQPFMSWSGQFFFFKLWYFLQLQLVSHLHTTWLEAIYCTPPPLCWLRLDPTQSLEASVNSFSVDRAWH